LLAGTLLSIHNVRALIRLVQDVRLSILDGTFHDRLPAWLATWRGNAVRDRQAPPLSAPISLGGLNE